MPNLFDARRLSFQLLLLMLFLMPLLITPVFSLSSYAATLKVSQDGSGRFTKIQAAIDAARSRDTVLVGDGIYTGDGNRDIDFHGKSLTLKSLHGAAKTVIDCGGCESLDGSGDHRGFYLHSGERYAVISGFTVKNGYEGKRNNYIADSGAGGGILSSGRTGAITLGHCIISGNTAQGGGGLTNFNDNGGTITLTHCMISKNTALESGGGVTNGNSTSGRIILTACIISGNTSKGHGGGIFNVNEAGGTISITDSLITKNTAEGNGAVSGATTSSAGPANPFRITPLRRAATLAEMARSRSPTAWSPRTPP